jgi:nucleotidyltransferase/DNA polymerase involved in DNA repair
MRYAELDDTAETIYGAFKEEAVRLTRTSGRMNPLGIETGLDLLAQTLSFLQQHFGKSGPHYYWIARGVDERLVRAACARTICKPAGLRRCTSRDGTAGA